MVLFGSVAKNSTSGQQYDVGSLLRGRTVSVTGHAQGRHALPTVAGHFRTMVDQQLQLGCLHSHSNTNVHSMQLNFCVEMLSHRI